MDDRYFSSSVCYLDENALYQADVEIKTTGVCLVGMGLVIWFVALKILPANSLALKS
jgi:hypothetical protein